MTRDGSAEELLPSEREKWETEKAFRAREIAIKEREQTGREGELELKRREQASSGWRSPLVVAIMAATVAAAGNAAVTIVNGVHQRRLEEEKSEQARILEMIKTGDPDKAAGNLEFLLKAGLISNSDLQAKLRDFLSKRTPGSGPTLPTQTGFLTAPVTKLSGIIEQVELSPHPSGDVQVFILMSVTNEGQQPTSVQQYSLRISHVSSKSIDVKGVRPLEIKDRTTLLKNRVTLPPRAGNKDNLILQPRDAIVSRTAVAVPIGGKESGWMWFKLPLLTPKDLSQPGIIYTVSFADVTGTMYEASYQVR